MFELLGGIAIGGVMGFIAKDKFFPDTKGEDIKRQNASLYAENEKFASRNKELERQVEDLLAVKKETKRQVEEQEGLEDIVSQLKKDIRTLQIQNGELQTQVKEYKAACESLQAENALLKEKLG